MAEAIENRAADPSLRRRALVLVAHHPPFARGPGLDWFDGLSGGARIMALLARHANVHAMHGHLHEASDRFPSGGAGAATPPERTPARIFGASAVVDDEERARVRIYEVRNGGLHAAGLAS
jgi:hypothetical protein